MNNYTKKYILAEKCGNHAHLDQAALDALQKYSGVDISREGWSKELTVEGQYTWKHDTISIGAAEWSGRVGLIIPVREESVVEVDDTTFYKVYGKTFSKHEKVMTDLYVDFRSGTRICIGEARVIVQPSHFHIEPGYDPDMYNNISVECEKRAVMLAPVKQHAINRTLLPHDLLGDGKTVIGVMHLNYDTYNIANDLAIYGASGRKEIAIGQYTIFF